MNRRKGKDKITNYFGQLRFYSLFDLILLLIAVRANNLEFIGVIFLHIGFLVYLEARHNHSYREEVPVFFSFVFLIFGVFFYQHIALLGFLLASFFYTIKDRGGIGIFSSIFRGLQIYFLIGGIIGFSSNITYLAFGLMFVRNLIGDFRDLEKDNREKLKTLPLVLGFRKSWKYVYLPVIMITSFIWWYIADLEVIYLGIVYIIQILSYNLTPR
jgi:1,4-dihydroxy-2-naphthoate octaprenyltransferase